MAVKKFIVGCFEDENVLFPAVSKVRKAGYKIHDIYTPYAVHGLDKAMGLRETSLHTAGFIFGLTGTTTAVTFMTWSFTKDWPVNIGGKPNFALPAWIPITFELTVLMASVGMVLSFCYLCQLAPFIKKHHFHARATDDLFVMVIECTARTNEEEVKNLLNQSGAQQVNTQVAEDGWWIGRYDREQKLYKEDQAIA
jgi:Protein of unknown function (DUF3341)